MVRDGAAWRLPRAHGDMPVHARGLRSLDCTLVTGVRKHHNFFTIQQAMALRDIAAICSIADDGVYQVSVSNCINIRPHAKVPLVAFLCLVHLCVPRARAALDGAKRCISRAINDRVGLEHQTPGDQGGVDRGQQLNVQVVLFKQVTTAQKGEVDFTRFCRQISNSSYWSFATVRNWPKAEVKDV